LGQVPARSIVTPKSSRWSSSLSRVAVKLADAPDAVEVPGATVVVEDEVAVGAQ
jgi:hypothetical protein